MSGVECIALFVMCRPGPRVLALGYLAAAGRAFDETAFRTPGLIGFAAQIALSYVTARRAQCRCLRTFGDIAATRRTFHKAAHDTFVLIRFAARFAALDLPALRTEFYGAFGLGLLAAVTAQQCPDKNRGHQDQ